MKSKREIIDRIQPRQQTDWDIRGALNFILGGAGAGLLVATALATSQGGDLRALEALGLALVAAGLLSVLMKIGRPLRALRARTFVAESKRFDSEANGIFEEEIC